MEYEPRLDWDGPDGDGDYIVVLMGVPRWHLAAHGRSPKHALAMLAEAIVSVAEIEDVHGKAKGEFINRLGEKQKNP